MANRLDKRDDAATAVVDDAINGAKAAPAPTVPQRAPELVAHAARISRETARQGKLS